MKKLIKSHIIIFYIAVGIVLISLIYRQMLRDRHQNTASESCKTCIKSYLKDDTISNVLDWIAIIAIVVSAFIFPLHQWK